jgi:hypothetical protein
MCRNWRCAGAGNIRHGIMLAAQRREATANAVKVIKITLRARSVPVFSAGSVSPQIDQNP